MDLNWKCFKYKYIHTLHTNIHGRELTLQHDNKIMYNGLNISLSANYSVALVKYWSGMGLLSRIWKSFQKAGQKGTGL